MKRRFKYKAKRGPHEQVEGILFAESSDEAVDKINEMGLLPVDVSEEKEKDIQKLFSAVKRGKLGGRELVVFYRHLSKLIKAGVPVLRALAILAEEAANPAMKDVIENIQAKIREGESFSQTLADFSGVFSAFDIALINAGEGAGSLEESLLRIGNYREQQDVLLKKVRTAIAYPVFLLAAGVATVSFMMAVVIPRFAQFFSDLGQNLPLPTRILISVSDAFQRGWPAGLGLLLFAYFMGRRSLKNKKGKMAFDRLLLKIPKIGDLIVKTETVRLSRTLSLLLKSGVHILTAVRISIPVLQNEAVRFQLDSAYRILQEGGNFSDILRDATLIPRFVFHLAKVGEETGRLDDILLEVADWYDQETDLAVQGMLKLLEPLLILGVGLVLSFVIGALLLPVFSINAMVQ